MIAQIHIAVNMAQINQYSWNGGVIDKVDENMKTLSSKTSSKFHMGKLQQNNPLNTLNDIHIQFVIISLEKANGDVAFICDRFYAFILMKELGLDHNNSGTNKTYIPVHITNSTVFLRNKSRFADDEENKKLPKIQEALKIHKFSSEARFIIAGPHCSCKPLSKAVT